MSLEELIQQEEEAKIRADENDNERPLVDIYLDIRSRREQLEREHDETIQA